MSMRPNRSRVTLVISSAAESLVRSVWIVRKVGSLASITRAGGECFQRPTISIDAGDLDACRQQSPRHCSADAPRRTGHDRHSLGFGHGMLPPALPTSILL